MPKLILDAGFLQVTVSYLQRRSSGLYYYYRRIPEELRGHYQGKRFRLQSLKTRDERDALKKVAEMESRGSLLAQVDDLADHMSKALELTSALCERQLICAKMLNDSFFLPSADVQFVVRVSAVEALCDQTQVSSSLTKLVDDLIVQLDATAADAGDKEILRNALIDKKRKSIHSAYKTKFEQLVSKEAYKEFKALYDKRSRFVHDGEGRGSFTQDAERALDLAVTLLFAELDKGRGSSPPSA